MIVQGLVFVWALEDGKMSEKLVAGGVW